MADGTLGQAAATTSFMAMPAVVGALTAEGVLAERAEVIVLIVHDVSTVVTWGAVPIAEGNVRAIGVVGG